MEMLNAELQNEKQLRSSATSLTQRISKENEAIKRAVQSLGCKVQFSGSGDCTVDTESSLIIHGPQKIIYSPSIGESDGSLRQDEKPDVSVSLTVAADDDPTNYPIDRACEKLCPLRSRDGGCRWPDTGCAQLGSQFVGIKANFDAFDRLSIVDSYFQPK